MGGSDVAKFLQRIPTRTTLDKTRLESPSLWNGVVTETWRQQARREGGQARTTPAGQKVGGRATSPVMRQHGGVPPIRGAPPPEGLHRLGVGSVAHGVARAGFAKDPSVLAVVAGPGDTKKRGLIDQINNG